MKKTYFVRSGISSFEICDMTIYINLTDGKQISYQAETFMEASRTESLLKEMITKKRNNMIGCYNQEGHKLTFYIERSYD